MNAEARDVGDVEAMYEQALQILNEALTFGIHPSLDGIRALMNQMGEPHLHYPSIQVAGTNGKTSTTRMLAALLGAHGLKTGLYTSPHLVEYPERIEVADKVISHELFAKGVLRAKEAADVLEQTQGMTITEFELITAAAMWIFSQENIDVAVLECGMGGRWDSTSVVDPKVAVVTGIGLDHLGILGDTVEEIAAEKAAIIGPDSKAVLGPGTQATLDVFMQRCAECGLTPWLVRESGLAGKLTGEAAGGLADRLTDGLDGGSAEKANTTTSETSSIVAYSAGYDSQSGFIDVDVECPLATYPQIVMEAPLYQAQNIATALAAAELFYEKQLDPKIVRATLGAFSIPGRFETLSEDPLLIVDAAHNPQSALNLATAIARKFPKGNFQLLLAVLSDKDAMGIIEALSGLTPDIAVTSTSSPRALLVDELAEMVKKASGTEPESFANPAEALDELLERGVPVVASGSITLAGEVKGLFCSCDKVTC